jgi:hypothetical protein
MSNKEFSVYALKAVQPSQEDGQYWIPQLYAELKEGRARFGWGRMNIRALKKTISEKSLDTLSSDEKDSWDHAAFLLEAQEDDYLIYINMPEYGKCSLVQVGTGSYTFGEAWDEERRGDFQHYVQCRFISTFDRNDSIVAPYLSVRLKLQGSHWRISAEEEFNELLVSLEGVDEGRTAHQRLSAGIADALASTAEIIRKTFPNKNLEGLVQAIFQRVPSVRDVRKGPDWNGADLVIEFDAGIPGLPRTEVCAVQVKAYEGMMGYERAIEDIKKAFSLNPEYTCGLIVSTALELTAAFEESLESLRQECGKPVGILLGKDLALTLIRHHAVAERSD